MKKVIYVLGVFIALTVIIVACEKAIDEKNDVNRTESALKGGNNCATIPGGTLYTSGGDLITPGFMDNGYNYQAHIQNFVFDDGWKLVMKWSDSWLSNKDCNWDGKLDRPSPYIGSGAWCTNHWTITYLDNGVECEYDEFLKIIAVPETAVLVDGYWFNEDGVEIGESIWGQFAIIQLVVNDPCAGIEGVQYKSPDHPGLGNW